MSHTLAIHHPVPMPKSQCKAHMYSQGFGTWQSEPGKVHDAVLAGIKAGYRLIDCARVYCNQAEIGQALKKAFDSNLVKREDLFIVSKIWNTEHKPEDVQKSTEESIKELQCGYLDLLLIHWPVAFEKTYVGFGTRDWSDLRPQREDGTTRLVDIPMIDTWRAMEKLVDEKNVRDIGLSNFAIDQIEDICKNARIHPSVLQIECHVALPQDELRGYCAKKGLAVMGYCPLAIGMQSKTISPMHDPKIKEIAQQQYGVEGKEAQLLLQWSNQVGNVVLSKSVSEKRINENSQVPFQGLSNETMKALAEYAKDAMQSRTTRVCSPMGFLVNPGIRYYDK